MLVFITKHLEAARAAFTLKHMIYKQFARFFLAVRQNLDQYLNR